MQTPCKTRPFLNIHNTISIKELNLSLKKSPKSVLKLMLFSILLYSCRNDYKSKIFENCTCHPIEIKKGIIHSDYFDNYTIKVPDTSWTVELSYDSGAACLLTYNKQIQSPKVITICQSMKQDSLKTLKEKLKEIESNFNISKMGYLKLDSLDGYWHLTDDSLPSLYITLELNKTNTFYTIGVLNLDSTISIDGGLCQLEPIIFSFKRNENNDDLELNYTKKAKYIDWNK